MSEPAGSPSQLGVFSPALATVRQANFGAVALAVVLAVDLLALVGVTWDLSDAFTARCLWLAISAGTVGMCAWCAQHWDFKVPAAIAGVIGVAMGVLVVWSPGRFSPTHDALYIGLGRTFVLGPLGGVSLLLGGIVLAIAAVRVGKNIARR